MNKPHNPPAFPFQSVTLQGEPNSQNLGMTLRDYFAGQALANSTICTGKAPDWQLKRWFGNATGITGVQIVARQAFNYADAMLAERERSQ